MQVPKNPATPNPAPAAQAKAGQPPKDPETETETIRVPVNEVNLIFTATDKHGRFVKDLKEQDVKVVDDHKPVDKILSFRSETDLPLRVGLLIDASNSIRERFKFEQESATEFLSQIVRPKSDQAFVLGFDTVPEVTQDFTNDTEKLGHGVRMLRPGGGTALFDALYYACRDKLMKVSEGQAVRRATVGLNREGFAAKSQHQPITFLDSISNYQKAVEVADGYGEKVTDPTEVMPALERGLRAVNVEKRQAVINIICSA